MVALTSLFSSLKELFGRTFVLVGMLPAGVILVGWSLYRSNLRYVELLKETASVETVGVFGLLLLGLGLLFYALHLPIFEMFRVLPSPPFALVRPAFLKLHRNRRLQLERLREIVDWNYTALCWPIIDFARSEFKPQWVTPPTANEVTTASHKARSTLAKIAGKNRTKPRIANDRAFNVIVEGLRLLRESSYAAQDDDWYKAEINEWRILLEQDGTSSLEQLQRTARSKMAAVFSELQKFPDNLEWVMPTILGNRAAALDDYSEKRYGMSTGLLWSRLYYLLDEKQREPAMSAQLSVHLYTNLSAALSLLTLMYLGDSIAELWQLRVYPLRNLRPDLEALGFMAGTCTLARVFYLSSVTAFDGLVEQIESTIDIHRNLLLDALNYQVPSRAESEKALYISLSRFFLQSVPVSGHWRRKIPVDANEADTSSLVTEKIEKRTLESHGLALTKPLPVEVLQTSPSNVPLIDLLGLNISTNYLLLLGAKGEPTHLLDCMEIGLFMRFWDTDGSLSTVADLFYRFPLLEREACSRFITMLDSNTIIEAQKLIYPFSKCLDIIITKDGSRESEAKRWITNIDMAAAIRA